MTETAFARGKRIVLRDRLRGLHKPVMTVYAQSRLGGDQQLRAPRMRLMTGRAATGSDRFVQNRHSRSLADLSVTLAAENTLIGYEHPPPPCSVWVVTVAALSLRGGMNHLGLRVRRIVVTVDTDLSWWRRKKLAEGACVTAMAIRTFAQDRMR